VTLPEWSLHAALGALAAAVTVWNLSHGVRLSTHPAMSRAFRTLSGLCAFLVVPALAIGVLAPTAPGARVLGPLTWLWPLVAVGIAVQAAWATRRGSAGMLLTLPIAIFDTLAAWVAVVRWADGWGASLPWWTHAPGVAVASLAAAALGSWAFPWAGALLVPALAPAAPARHRLTRLTRTLGAAAGMACVAVIGAATPRALGALIATRRVDRGTAAPRARSDLAVGLRLFGALDGAPPGAIARFDVGLADSLGVSALQVEFAPEGATTGAIDSVARSLELSRDSVLVVVTLSSGHALERRAGAEAQVRERLAAIERITRRLHPDVLVPADGVTTGSGAPDVAWWRSFYERAAATARHADRDVTIALATDASTRTDSTLCDWVLQGGSPVDAIAVMVRDDGARPARFVAALDAMARWASLARRAPTVWLLGVPAAPLVTGEATQRQLVRHALAWGAAHAWVRGIVAGDASDLMTATALRTATGRPRPALAEVGALLRAQRDLPAVVPTADPIPPPDSMASSERRLPPESRTPPSR